MSTVSTSVNARVVVETLISALNYNDFNTARTLLADHFKFRGVMGHRDSADAYMDDMRSMRLKYKVHKVFADTEDVCLFYDLEISSRNIFCCGLYHVVDGKVESLKVLFDPRPLLN